MANKQAIHTFVLCAYGENPYLEACIVSVINQETVKSGKSEVIMYSSTPSQFLDDLCAKYEIPFFTKSGGGISKDWTNALSFVTTKYGTIAQQDEIYLENYGTEILKSFQKSEDTLMVYSDYSEIDGNGELRPRNIGLKIKTFALHVMNWFPRWKFWQRRIFAFGDFISAPAVSLNMEKLPNFEFNEKYRMVLDWDAWERIMKMPGIMRYVKGNLMYHRIHEGSTTTAEIASGRRNEEELEMFNRYWPEFISKVIMKIYTQNQKFN